MAYAETFEAWAASRVGVSYLLLAAAIYNTLMAIGADCAQLAGYKDGL